MSGETSGQIGVQTKIRRHVGDAAKNFSPEKTSLKHDC